MYHISGKELIKENVGVSYLGACDVARSLQARLTGSHGFYNRGLSFNLGFGLSLKNSGSGFRKFGLGKRFWYWFRNIWSQKKLSVSVSENLVPGNKSLGFGKKGLVSVSVILVSSHSGCCLVYQFLDPNFHHFLLQNRQNSQFWP